MALAELPDHLRPVLTDEPVFDLYAYGPWRVPDGLYEQVTERANALNTDPRVADLPYSLSDFYGANVTVVGAELWCLLQYLPGVGAVRGGNRCDIEYEMLNAFQARPEPPDRDPVWACFRASNFRPPGDW